MGNMTIWRWLWRWLVAREEEGGWECAWKAAGDLKFELQAGIWKSRGVHSQSGLRVPLL